MFFHRKVGNFERFFLNNELLPFQLGPLDQVENFQNEIEININPIIKTTKYNGSNNFIKMGLWSQGRCAQLNSICRCDMGYGKMEVEDVDIFCAKGFWPDGIYSPPTEEAMVWDLQQVPQSS